MNEKDLYDIAYFELRNRLQSIPGVIAPAVYGGKLRRILAYIDRGKLESRDLAPMDIVHALESQNVFIPAGNIKAGDLDYQLFANAMPERVAELNDIPIGVGSEGAIYLRDVATARDAAQIQTNIVRVNGRRQVYIPIYRQPGANTIEIVDSIQRNLERILQRLREMDPRAQDLALEVVLDQSVYVRSSLGSLRTAGLLGAVMAALVVFLVMRTFRTTLVVLLTLPLAVLAAMAGLFFTGATLNAMTIGGLALVLGILVDQAIVVVESIVRHVEKGVEPFQAALQGASEVAIPTLVSTMTFCVVFFPIVFLTGMARYLFGPLAIAAIMAMAASYLFAITLVPAFMARLFRRRGKDRGDSNREWGPARAYGRLLEVVFGRRRLILAGGALLFLLTLGLLRFAGSEFFPRVDAGQFQVFVRLPSGTRIERTEEAVAAIERILIEEIGEPDPEFPKKERHPESNLRMLISNIGVLMDWPAAYTPNTGPMDAFLLVQLKGKRGMPGTFDHVARLRETLKERFQEVEVAFDTGGMMTAAVNLGEPAPIHIQILGSNLDVSHEIAGEIANIVERTPGTGDVRIAQRHDYPTVRIEIDRVKAAYSGIDVQDIMKNLVTATNSSIGFNPAFWIDEGNGNHYFVGAQYAEEDLASLETIQEIPIRGDGGRIVPLRTLARMHHETGPAVVSHRNITRVVDVYADVEGGENIGSVVSEIERRLGGSKELAPRERESDRSGYFELAGERYAGKGYGFTMTGEVATMRETFHQFLSGFFLAVVLVYLVLVLQFRSFVDPFVVLFAVPLGLVGVAIALAVTGTNLSIMAAMGILMMVGIVVAYSVLLVDFANRLLRDGAGVVEAMGEAARARLRPIVMTSLSTVLALLPMAIGGKGGEANAPLARAIIGGVLSAAALSLVVVPALYVSLKRGGKGTPALVLPRVGEREREIP